MAKSKDDITYGTAQAKLSEDEATRVAYKHGTPLEGGKIAESETVDMFSSARNMPKPRGTDISDSDSDQSHLQRNTADDEEGGGGGSGTDFTTGAPRLPKKGPPSNAHKF